MPNKFLLRPPAAPQNISLMAIKALCWLLLAAGLLACQPKPNAAGLHVDPAGRYAVWFPYAPRVPTSSDSLAVINSPNSPLANILAAIPLAGTGRNSLYQVTYGDTETAMLHSDSLVFIQDYLWASQFMLHDSAQLLSRSAFKLNGYQGADFTWRSNFRRANLKGLLIRTRVMLVKQRLYTLAVAGAEPASKRANQFFDSFQLRDTPPGVPAVIRYKVPGQPGEIIETRYPGGAVLTTIEVLKGTVDQTDETLQRRYFPTGKLANETRFRQGLQHGLARTWYATGALANEYVFSNDALAGVGTEYYRNGNPEIKMKYGVGQAPELTFYDPDGIVRSNPEAYIESLIHEKVAPWSPEQRARARAQCIEKYVRRQMPEAYCDCYLSHVEKKVKPSDYMALGMYGGVMLVTLVGADECDQF